MLTKSSQNFDDWKLQKLNDIYDIGLVGTLKEASVFEIFLETLRKY